MILALCTLISNSISNMQIVFLAFEEILLNTTMLHIDLFIIFTLMV